MARVDEKGIIRYESAAEYVEQYDSNISQGGFFVEAAGDWPLRQQRNFAIYVGATDTGVRLQAEVVFNQGGRLGLQIERDSPAAQALAALAEELRGGPILDEQGTISYNSATAFLVDFASNIAAGGFYVSSQHEWPAGQVQQLKLAVGGIDTVLEFRAKIVMCQAELVGLQVEHTRDNVAAFNQFVVQLRKRRKAELGQLDQQVATETAKQAEPSRAFTRPVQGLAVATRDFDEFRAIRARRRLADGATVSFFELLLSLAAARQPLKLLVEANGDRHQFWFDEQGLLVAYEGPRSDLDFVDRLLEAQFIDEDTRGSLRAELGGRKSALQLALEQGVVGEHQAALVFRQQLVDAFEHCRARGEVRYLVDPLPRAPENPVGVELARLLAPWLERAFKALPAALVKQMLKPVWNTAPVPVIEPPFTLAQLHLPAGEEQFANRLDGQTSLKGALADVDKSLRDRFIRLALSLLALGLLNAEGWGKLAKPAAAKPVPTGKPAGDTEREPEVAGEEIEALAKEVARLQEANLFERLGVHWSAHPRMFAVAMQELHRRYGPDSPLSRAGTRAAELCRQRLQMAREALVQLQNPARRVEHRGQEVAVALRAQSARLMEQKAEQMLNQQKPAEAVELLEMACELDPTPENQTRLATVKRYYKAE